MRVHQADVGRCVLLDVLEVAALRRGMVAIEVRGRDAFVDRVVDVVTESGEDYVVFKAHERAPLTDVLWVTRREQPS